MAVVLQSSLYRRLGRHCKVTASATSYLVPKDARSTAFQVTNLLCSCALTVCSSLPGSSPRGTARISRCCGSGQPAAATNVCCSNHRCERHLHPRTPPAVSGFGRLVPRSSYTASVSLLIHGSDLKKSETFNNKYELQLQRVSLFLPCL
jgi:hypothetical protein